MFDANTESVTEEIDEFHRRFVIEQPEVDDVKTEFSDFFDGIKDARKKGLNEHYTARTLTLIIMCYYNDILNQYFQGILVTKFQNIHGAHELKPKTVLRIACRVNEHVRVAQQRMQYLQDIKDLWNNETSKRQPKTPTSKSHKKSRRR